MENAMETAMPTKKLLILFEWLLSHEFDITNMTVVTEYKPNTTMAKYFGITDPRDMLPVHQGIYVYDMASEYIQELVDKGYICKIFEAHDMTITHISVAK